MTSRKPTVAGNNVKQEPEEESFSFTRFAVEYEKKLLPTGTKPVNGVTGQQNIRSNTGIGQYGTSFNPGAGQ